MRVSTLAFWMSDWVWLGLIGSDWVWLGLTGFDLVWLGLFGDWRLDIGVWRLEIGSVLSTNAAAIACGVSLQRDWSLEIGSYTLRYFWVSGWLKISYGRKDALWSGQCPPESSKSKRYGFLLEVVLSFNLVLPSISHGREDALWSGQCPPVSSKS